MIKFEFQFDNKEIATVNNISDLFRNQVWKMFEEAVTQHVKPLLIHDLEPIRDELEKGNAKIICNFNKETEQFDFSYIASPEVADKLEAIIKKKIN